MQKNGMSFLIKLIIHIFSSFFKFNFQKTCIYIKQKKYFLNVQFVCSQIQVMLFATISYFICLVGIILMYIWYAPQPSCLLNIFFITWTLVLLQLMTSVSLHPKVSTVNLLAFACSPYFIFHHNFRWN